MKSLFKNIFLIVLLTLLASFFKKQEALSFLSSFDLWYEPVLASMICGTLCSLAGLYLVMNQMTLTGLALTQTSGLGIFVAFFLLSFIPLSESLYHTLPLMMGVFFGVGTILLFVNKKKLQELLTAMLYVGGASLILILGDRVAEGHHEIESFLFGNAVAIAHHDFFILLSVSAVLFLVFILRHKHFVAVSLDGDDYQVSGYARGQQTTLLYLVIAMAITISMKTMGQLPVLGFLVFPVATAMQQSRSFRETFIQALLFGCMTGPVGYYFSYIYSFPTGASIVATGLLFYGSALVQYRNLNK